MGILINSDTGNYTNLDAVENVIRYITRTRKDENRLHELISYGGHGVSVFFDSTVMIMQFCKVQQFFGIQQRGGRRMRHEFFRFSDYEMQLLMDKLHLVDMIAKECSVVYFDMGFQVVYAVHYDTEKRLHIHFGVNSVNYINGKKFHSEYREFYGRERRLNEIVRKYVEYVSVCFADNSQENFNTDYFDRASAEMCQMLYQ